MAYLVGGGAAAVVLLYDLKIGRRFLAPFGALPLWALRLVVQGLQGALAIALLKGAATKFGAIDGMAAWLVAGISAPAILQNLRYGDPASPGFSLDLGDRIGRITGPLDERIDAASADAEGRVRDRMVKRLLARAVTADDLAERLLTVIRARRDLETRTIDAEYVRAVAESNDSEKAKLELIVDKARSLGAFRTIKYAAKGR